MPNRVLRHSKSSRFRQRISNFHDSRHRISHNPVSITWHTKTGLPMINERIESRLYHYLTHKILETSGARLHAIGGIKTHIHIATSLQPNILVSDWIRKLKGSSSYYINHEVQPKALEWQRDYGIVTFGTKDLKWVVDYVNNQKEHHKKGTIRDRLEKHSDDG